MQDAAILHGLQGLGGGALRGKDQGESENAGNSIHLVASTAHIGMRRPFGSSKHFRRRRASTPRWEKRQSLAFFPAPLDFSHLRTIGL
jgi:hypothetical protein